MRIAFVTTGTLKNWGTNYRILGLASCLVQQRVDAHILLPGHSENRLQFPGSHYKGAPIHFAETGAWSEMRSKYQILRELRPDVVHCMDVIKRSFPSSLAYCTRYSVPLIVDIDEHLSKVFRFPKNLYALLGERVALRRADSIIVASRFLEKVFLKRRSGGGSLLYLPNGADLDYFLQHADGSQKVRQRWAGRKIVTYFGSLLPRYDADIVLEAAIRMLEKRRDLIFVFIGTGPLLESYRRRTAELRLEKWFDWRGFVPDEEVPGYLSASDALVFPIRDNWTNRARCPGKLYHFAAAMVPVVTNPVGEIKEALGDRAWYFREGDTDDFIRVLERCLKAGRDSLCADAALAARHSWQARDRVYLGFLEQKTAVWSLPGSQSLSVRAM